MKGWTEKKIRDLQQSGRIRGSQAPAGGEHKRVYIPPKRTAPLKWLDLNLLKWCNDHAVELKTEHRICADRKWRFDYAIPAHMIAIEYEGGIFLQYNDQHSGHGTAKHYTKDTDKYNRAQLEGWRIIRVTALNYTTVISLLNDFIK